jgi:hypothetical protein
VKVDIGLWRSTRGDTHPHVGLEVEWDYWPQATHLVWEAPALVACMTGGGGGSQQAMFKRDLDPLLAGALERWQRSPITGTPVTAIDRFFAEVQAGFEALTEPAWAAELQATGVAVTVRDDGAAVGHVGIDRAYRWRGERLVQLTVDDSLAKASAPAQVPEWFRHTSASALRKASPERPDFTRWSSEPLDVAPGDILVLASGIHDIDVTTSYLAGALENMFDDGPRLAGAQDLASRLGDTMTRFAAASPRAERTEWKIHSRLALAVLWID